MHKNAHEFFNDRKQNTPFSQRRVVQNSVNSKHFCVNFPEFYPDRIKNEQNKGFTALKTQPRGGNLLYRKSNVSIRAQTWTLVTETDLCPLAKQTSMRQFSRNQRFFGVLFIRNFTKLLQKCSAADTRSPKGRQMPSAHIIVFFLRLKSLNIQFKGIWKEAVEASGKINAAC